MSAPRNDVDAELEYRLAATLHARAATIVATPPYPLPDRGAVRARDRRARYGLISAGLAAAIVVAGVAIRVEHQEASKAASASPQCVRSVPNDFGALLAANRIAGATGTIVSGASDGSLLLAGPGNRSLSLVDPNGRPTTIWTAATGEQATVDPQAAISDDAVVFAVGPQHATPTTIEVYRRDEQRLETLANDSPSAPLLGIAPIVMNDSGYWVTGTPAGPDKIEYFGLQDQTSTPDSVSVIPATSVTQLLAVGGILGWVQSAPNSPTHLEFYPTDQVPTSVIPDSQSGSHFTSDRSTVSWLTNSGDRHTYWMWSPGDPNPQNRALTWKEADPGIVGPYLAAASPKAAILDTSTGATVDLPAATRLVGVFGSQAVFSTAQAGGTVAISRLALADVAFAGC